MEKTYAKYKIGKVRQIPTVMKDEKTGLEYIQLQSRENEKVYGVTRFSNNYRGEQKLGQGTFGEVFKGVHLATNRKVAIKRILVRAEKDLFPITAQREITILKRMDHKNIVKLIEMIYDESPTQKSDDPLLSGVNNLTAPPGGKHFFMILPYMVSDLTGLLHNPRVSFEMGDIKNMMLQLFEGINYIHCCKFLHRDIKAANILIDHKGVLKIADFGLARNYYGCPPNLKYPGGAGSGAKYTSVVATRWYRAPEIVLGDRHYTTAVDMWGIGCVFAEFFEKKPILQGQSDIDQGHVIFKLMGTPSMNDWTLAYHLPGAELTKTNYKSTLSERFSKYLTDAGLDLLGKLLSLDPYKRLTAMAAKKHPFFEEEPLPKDLLAIPNEECHESDIKRYKEEMHQSMSQRQPSAPVGHTTKDSSVGPVGADIVKSYATPKINRAEAKTPSTGPHQVSRYSGSYQNIGTKNTSHFTPSIPRGPKSTVSANPSNISANPRESYISRGYSESRYNNGAKDDNETPNAGRKRLSQRDAQQDMGFNKGSRYSNPHEFKNTGPFDKRPPQRSAVGVTRYQGTLATDRSATQNAIPHTNRSSSNNNIPSAPNPVGRERREGKPKNKAFKAPNSKDVADYY